MDAGYIIIAGLVAAWVGFKFGYVSGFRQAIMEQAMALWRFAETLEPMERLDFKNKLRQYNEKVEETRKR